MGITNVYEKTEAQMTTKEKLERDKGMVLHLDFSTPYSADNLILDKSGNNNHATVVPSTAPVWVENGMIGKGAYSFDGSKTNYITIPTNAITNFQDFTVSMWVNSSNLSKGINTIIHATNTGGNDFSIEMYSNRFVPLLLGNERIFYTSNSVNTWYHVALKRTGAVVEMFKDGVSLGTNTFNSALLNITGAIILGQEQDALGGGFDANQAFEGLIDDVRIYSTALSASEVKELYQTRATVDEGGNLSVMGISLPSAAVSDGLVGWWKLDGNALDSSGNGNDGTVYGATPVDGIIGGAYSFDGVDDYITIDDFKNNINSKFTVSFWGKFNRYSYMQIMTTSTTNFKWRVNSQNPYWNIYKNTGGHAGSLGYTTRPNINEWYLFTSTYDGSIHSIYLNGVLNNKITRNIDILIPTMLNISDIGGEKMDGSIDDVRIYNRALEYGEIKLLYSLGVDSIWK